MQDTVGKQHFRRLAADQTVPDPSAVDLKKVMNTENFFCDGNVTAWIIQYDSALDRVVHHVGNEI